MGNRIELQRKLACALGSSYVYFQPPETIKMNYPCIVYRLARDYVNYADDIRYKEKNRYEVTVIDKNPDSTIPDNIKKFRYCAFDRTYTADNLNHFVFTLYY